MSEQKRNITLITDDVSTSDVTSDVTPNMTPNMTSNMISDTFARCLESPQSPSVRRNAFINHRNNSKENFLNDKLQFCLKNGIISEKVANNKLWSDLKTYNNIEIDMNEISVVYINPFNKFSSRSDFFIPSNEYWDFTFMQLILPDNVKLKLLSTKIDSENFEVLVDDKSIARLTYF